VRKLIVLEFLTLDGVIQGPGSPEEDPSGGFTHGGWTAPYGDPVGNGIIQHQMGLPFDLLLGRKTFDIWANYWPEHSEFWPGVRTATKYVASRTLKASAWEPTVVLGGEAGEAVKALKQTPGPDLHVYGSADLVQTLLSRNLVDELWLKIYPITLGSGKRLFTGGTIPAQFEVVQSTVTPKGVILISYRRVNPSKGEV
jgi:dihydrofolate reductase